MSRKPKPPWENGEIEPSSKRPVRAVSEQENLDWGLDECAAKIPEGKLVMIMGTKKP